jgi:hypothetical protein
MRSPIECPTCPVCGSEPLYAFRELLPWFCPRDECVVLAWDPYSSLEANLTDAAPVQVTTTYVDGPPAE